MHCFPMYHELYIFFLFVMNYVMNYPVDYAACVVGMFSL
jgi:hypothetical protein